MRNMDDTGSLKGSVLSAIGWAGATRFVGQLANWAMTLATIRFLSPRDYGLMAITAAVASLLQSMSSVGFANVIVQNRRIGEDDLRSVFGLILVSNGACLLLLCLLAPVAAWFCEEERLVPLLQFASLTFIASALQAIPRATLEKKLDLKSTSRIDMVSNVSGGALVLLLAWSGAGVWSLVSGALFNALLRTIGLGLVAPYFRRPQFTLRNLSAILHFGGMRTAETLLWTVYSSADVFIIGKLLGPQILGIYSVSRYVAALPIEKLQLVMVPIAFPAFSRVQDDRTAALRYLQKAGRILAVLCMPIFFGMAATSPQIVAVALGPKWSQATTPLAILAFGMALRPITLVFWSFLLGIGEYVACFKNTLFAAILFPIAFIIGSHWGLVGVCGAWLVANPLQLFNLSRRVALITKTSMAGLMRPLLSPLAASLIMYIVVRIAAAMLPDSLGAWGSLFWLVAMGALLYLSYVAVFLRPVVAEIANLVRR
jgi:O-antigen/teichoic acid export membrane protein